MVLLQGYDIRHFAGDRLLFSLDRLLVQDSDRIALIGDNGSGKSTLLKLFFGALEPDEGKLIRNGRTAYIEQITEYPEDVTLSGGELTQERLHEALWEYPELLLADEPDNHLDRDAIKYLEKELKDYPGALILVSHDRDLINRVCTTIWELEGGNITVFNGTYDEYMEKKRLERKEQAERYDLYAKEVKRLKKAAAETKQRSTEVKKTPSRMGNSEARLHKMGNQKAKKNLDKAADRIETRIEQLEPVSRPPGEKRVLFEFPVALEVHGPLICHASSLKKRFGEVVIFNDAEFAVHTGSRTHLEGANGSGKTTLLEMIRRGEEGISLVKQAKIGYLSQFFSTLNLEQTVLENVLSVSLYDETITRTTLARLQFMNTDVFKPCSVLSGGERNKVSLAMLMLGAYNFLLLDEPTNHMDVRSIEAVESALVDYPGTIFFVSHDRRFAQRVATDVLKINKQKIMRL